MGLFALATDGVFATSHDIVGQQGTTSMTLWRVRMPPQKIILELPEHLYRTVSKLAQVTKRPLAEILQESLAHTLPPLDDVPAEEVDVLAHMSTLDDTALWQASKVTMPEGQQEELHALLDCQSAGDLTPAGAVRLQELLDEYGRLLVRQSHAWLLLARRGYNVPIRRPKGSCAWPVLPFPTSYVEK